MLFNTNTIETNKVLELGLETERPGIGSMTILKVVSVISLVTNFFVASFLKVLSPKTSMRHIFWSMGRNEKHHSSFFVDSFSKVNHRAKVEAAGQGALDLFYNYHEKVEPHLKNDLTGYLTRFWMNIANRKAVRNRLAIVVEELEKAFLEIFCEQGEVRILSVASGSAQAVIKAMKKVPFIPFRVVLIDLDQRALDSAKSDAVDAGLLKSFKFVRGKTSLIEREAELLNPNIVEMVGFLDYRTEEQAIDLFTRIKAQLPVGGFFITCNIAPNPEKIFLDWVLLWPMIYRTKEVVADLLEKGGFQKRRVFYEPLKIHSIGVCRVV